MRVSLMDKSEAGLACSAHQAVDWLLVHRSPHHTNNMKRVVIAQCTSIESRSCTYGRFVPYMNNPFQALRYTTQREGTEGRLSMNPLSPSQNTSNTIAIYTMQSPDYPKHHLKTLPSTHPQQPPASSTHRNSPHSHRHPASS
jgi:hypothetical protein